MSFLQPNLVLCGTWRRATYTVLRQIRNDCANVWLGQSNDQQLVILKKAHSDEAFDTEVNALGGYLRGHSSFRQLVNIIPYEKIARKLEEGKVKRVTKVVLEGLETMHGKNMAHTDIKSDNIVVDFDQNGTFSKIKLIDLGDSVKIEPTTNHPFTHPTYRAPEGLFGAPWTTKVDIWALGTLIMWVLIGGRLFSPLGVDEKDEIYRVVILMLQCGYFGPFPQTSVGLSDDVEMEVLDGIEGLVTRNGGRRLFRNTLDNKIRQEAVIFLDKVMKLDPRDRSSPQELLQDRWLSGVVN